MKDFIIRGFTGFKDFFWNGKIFWSIWDLFGDFWEFLGFMGYFWDV